MLSVLLPQRPGYHLQAVACTTRGVQQVSKTYASYTETNLYLYTVATDYQRLP